MKKIVPIAFCFDDNLAIPAHVCLTSLLLNAHEDTFYDIYILHADDAKFIHGTLNQFPILYNNCKITFRSVGNAFQGAYEIRGITHAAYYRLLIPELIPEYDKIMYFDVDIIFQQDLSAIFLDTNLDDYYVAGVSTPFSDITAYVNTSIGMEIGDYICSGTIILNSKKILDDNKIPEFIAVAKSNWKYQDQDTLNLVCKDAIKILPPWFGVVGTVAEIAAAKGMGYYSQEDVDLVIQKGTIHYNGPKPWKGWCLNFDIWWEYYRKSFIFDEQYYLDFYARRMNDIDRLSLVKRLKIVLRYFKNGQLRD